MPVPEYPDFRDPQFLDAHIRSIMAFYHPRCIDTQGGGFFQHFRDDGSIYDAATRHLVSSTRFIFNYAMAARAYSSDEYRDAARHGIDYLRRVHRNAVTGGYAWLLRGNEILDSTNHCYGLAFVLLAYATAFKADLPEAGDYLTETYELMERYFWLADDELYADERSGDWRVLSSYRGQNANMHGCEAMLAAYEATSESHYLQRALTIARGITVTLATKAGGLVWEHYDSRWNVDWDYNRDDPRNLFRPWGYQPGHLTEWAKLLLILERHRAEEWLLPTARTLFAAAMEHAWDNEHDGICYGFDREGAICDGDKYFWVQAESLAAAALLAVRTGEQQYWEWYERIWRFAWQHMIDHRYGAWFRILDRGNSKYDELKSPAGKTDYHTMGACYEVLRSI